MASLAAHPSCRLIASADYIVTEPYGGVEQDDFLNGAVVIETLLTPRELLDLLHEIEQQADRKREIHWGPRTLDLDILLYDDLIVQEEDLYIPHIEMHKRDFVLRPLVQIAPYAIHPTTGCSILTLFERLQKEG